jgi:hypothetical protein
MINALLSVFFGCSHRNTTFPLTTGGKFPPRSSRTNSDRTYVVCLDCGKEFQYDWNAMRIGEVVRTGRTAGLAGMQETGAGVSSFVGQA